MLVVDALVWVVRVYSIDTMQIASTRKDTTACLDTSRSPRRSVSPQSTVFMPPFTKTTHHEKESNLGSHTKWTKCVV